MPGLVGGFGNYFLPIHCGSPDMAKINLEFYHYNSIKNIATLIKNNSSSLLLNLSNNDKQEELRLNKEYDNKNEVNNKYLKSYLAGLFEGDGHIWIPNSNLKKKHNPRFCITFNLKNEPLAKLLVEIIGYGHIRYKPKDNACVLIVSPVKGLKKIIKLINGELKTPKLHQLHKLIDWINTNHKINFKNLSFNNESLDKNSWLSGFVDADGSFSIRMSHLENKDKKRQISCRLRVEQRMVDPITNIPYFDSLNKIATFFNCNLLIRKQKTSGNNYYHLTASSCKSIQIILNYFDSYPLYSSKYLDYKDWAEAANIILEQTQYRDENIIKIKNLKNNMNNSRVYFNWSHLINLRKTPII